MIYVTFPHRCLTDVNVFLFVRLLTSIRLQHFILFIYLIFLSQVVPPNVDVVSMSNCSSLCVSCLSSVACV